jgi:hypothetical protein
LVLRGKLVSHQYTPGLSEQSRSAALIVVLLNLRTDQQRSSFALRKNAASRSIAAPGGLSLISWSRIPHGLGS